MTIGGALSELNNLLKADDIPIYYKPSIKAVMDTIMLSRSENPNKWISPDVIEKIKAEITEISVEEIRIEEKWARGLHYSIKVIDKYISPTGAEGSKE